MEDLGDLSYFFSIFFHFFLISEVFYGQSTITVGYRFFAVHLPGLHQSARPHAFCAGSTSVDFVQARNTDETLIIVPCPCWLFFFRVAPHGYVYLRDLRRSTAQVVAVLFCCVLSCADTHLLSQVIMDKNPKITTVVNKVRKIPIIMTVWCE